MIPRARRVSRGEFSFLRNKRARLVFGDWYAARIYSQYSDKRGKISIIVSAKTAKGIERNKIRRILYDAIAALPINYGTILFFVRTLPLSKDAINSAIANINQELNKIV